MSLIAWYPLNGTADNYGPGDLALTQTTAPAYTTGNVTPKSLRTGAYKWTAAQSASILNNAGFSYACWFYVDADTGTTASEYRKIFGAEGGTDCINRKFTIGQYPTVNGLHVSSWDGTKLVSCARQDSALPSRKWSHICVTYTPGSIRTYVNGSLLQTTSLTMNNASYAAETPVIWNYGGRRICDVRIYDHCLSQKEIRELAMGLAVHYPMDKLETLDGQPNMVLTHTAMATKLPQRANSNGTISTSEVIPDQSTETGYAIKFTVTPTDNTKGGNGGRYWVASQHVNIAELIEGETYTYSVKVRGSCPGQMILKNIIESQTILSCSHPIATYGLVQFYTEYQTYRITFKFTSTAKFTTCFYVAFAVGQEPTTLYVADPKLEPGAVATPWCPNIADPLYTQMGYSSTVCPDETGLGNNGTFTPVPPTLVTGSPHGRLACYLPTDTSIICNSPVHPETLTLSVWHKGNALARCGNWESGGGGIFIEDGKWKSQFYINGAYSTVVGAAAVADQWQLITTTYDGQMLKLYVNGELSASMDCGKYPITYHNTAPWTINGNPNGSGSTISSTDSSYWSDFRLYATALSADDIMSLYRSTASMDNLGNLHTGSLDESPMKVTMRRDSTVGATAFSEFMVKYDSRIYVEPDGSMWVRAFHHNNPVNAAFAANDTFATGVYRDADKWFAMDICNHMDKWEIIYEHRPTTLTDTQRFRWVQTVNPMVANFDQTKAALVTKYGTAEGYTAISASYGGMYRSSVGKAYLVCNNSNSGHWYGAIGMSTTEGMGSGQLPSYNQAWVSSGYVDIYVRVDNVDFTSYSKSGLSMNRSDSSISAAGLCEV